MTELDDHLNRRVAELSELHLPLAAAILREAIRIPADYVDRPTDEGGDPACGTSNHEGPRLEFFKQTIIDVGAVRFAEDVYFDDYGNLVWTVTDPGDGIHPDAKRVVYFDGHTDTVQALRSTWQEKLGGIDAYDGLIDIDSVDRDFLRGELGHLPPDDEWDELVFGRGAADQLGGVVAQIVATKIALELAGEGALRGVIIRAYATVCEEDNDGAGPMYLMKEVLPGALPDRIPDVVILTEGTGDAHKGALGIYRGQRGRMQIEVTVTGRSCHGSMPWEGLNPLEHGGAIIAEAARRYDERDGFLDDPFLGHGTRTASWSEVETPSDCAVPDRFTFRFDRRLTVGEVPDQAVADIEALDAVRTAREDGLTVDIRVPVYDGMTWRGYSPGNEQIYMGWATPAEHEAIQTAVAVYEAVVAPNLVASQRSDGGLRTEARVDRWIFSTDGVGFPVPADQTTIDVPSNKAWVEAGDFKHPAMFGFGPGIEQNTHKIGEFVDRRELRLAVAFLARFPGAYAELLGPHAPYED
ncbi:MAG: peptidase dimerization domain-containing protein [Acidimicrobiia bacterium]|nr:peptidase dimerization domain-containing protein [Acidimicrobiia bacterium]